MALYHVQALDADRQPVRSLHTPCPHEAQTTADRWLDDGLTVLTWVDTDEQEAP